MCLERNDSINRQIKKEIKNGKRDFYKVAIINRSGKIVSPFKRTPISSGFYISDRTNKRVDWCNECDRLYEGIHVYCNYEDAVKAKRKLVLWKHNKKVILKVIINPEDLVAAGEDEVTGFAAAVFMKIYIL